MSCTPRTSVSWADRSLFALVGSRRISSPDNERFRVRFRGRKHSMSQMAFQTSNHITGSRRWWVLGAILVTMFFSSMDQTVVSTAMPVIIGDLHGLNLYAWVFTGYMLASAVTVPIYGKLSDVYGRKPFFITGLVLFMVGSAVSGQAHTMMELVVARTGQGLGAGAMLVMPQATIGDIFNPRERGGWMGIIGAIYGLASLAGPGLGGWITDTLGWPWIFYVNLPIAALALALVWMFLPRVRTEQQAKPDVMGIGILVVALMGIMLGFTWAGSTYPWTSWPIALLLMVGTGGLGGFYLYERHASDPVISPLLFRAPIFTTASAVQLCISMALFGSIMFLPLFVQGVLGLSATESGVVMTPMMLSFITGSVVGGLLLTHTGRYRLQAQVSAALMTLGMLLLTRMSVVTMWPTVVVDVAILGLGVGSLIPLLNLAVQNAFPYRMLGMVSSSEQFVSSLGGVVALPILGSVMTRRFSGSLQSSLSPALAHTLGRLPAHVRSLLSDPQALTSSASQAAIRPLFSSLGGNAQLAYQGFIHAVRLALAHGMQAMFVGGLLLAVLALMGTFALPDVILKNDEFFADADLAGMISEHDQSLSLSTGLSTETEE